MDIPPIHAGTSTQLRVTLENAGTAAWRGLNLSYHWLDERRNPIHWDGMRTPIEAEPGERRDVTAELRGPIPPGRYVLAVDLVDEHRFWLAELGNHSPSETVDVLPRDPSGARAFVPDEVEPAPDWDERVQAAHREGFAAVGGSVRVPAGFFRRKAPPELEPYAARGGRNPGFAYPLVCPSLLPPLEPNTEVMRLPAWSPEGDEPWVYDARISVTLRPRRRLRPPM